MKIQELTSKYDLYLQFTRQLSVNTRMAYRRDLAIFMDFWRCSAPDWSAVDKAFIYGFLQANNHLSAASQSRMISALRLFFDFLVQENALSANPFQLIQKPKTTRPLPKVLTVHQVQQLLALAKGDAPHQQRNFVLLQLLYGAGLRVSEAIDLRIRDLFLEQGFLRVIGKRDKQRLVPIGGIIVRELQHYLQVIRPSFPKEKNSDFVFLSRHGQPLSRIMIFKIVRELAHQAGIPLDIGPHTFRHAFATHLLEGGANLRAVQQLLGHADIATTEIYTHLDDEFLRSEILQYHPLAHKNQPKGD